MAQLAIAILILTFIGAVILAVMGFLHHYSLDRMAQKARKTVEEEYEKLIAEFAAAGWSEESIRPYLREDSKVFENSQWGRVAYKLRSAGEVREQQLVQGNLKQLYRSNAVFLSIVVLCSFERGKSAVTLAFLFQQDGYRLVGIGQAPGFDAEEGPDEDVVEGAIYANDEEYLDTFANKDKGQSKPFWIIIGMLVLGLVILAAGMTYDLKTQPAQKQIIYNNQPYYPLD